MTTTGDLGQALVSAAAALDRARGGGGAPDGGAPGRVALTQIGAPLGGSRRSTVVRAAVDERSPHGGGRGLPERVVVKIFDPAAVGEGWVREAAALEVLGGDAWPGPASRVAAPPGQAPLLLAAAARPPLVVLSDLGTGPSLADSLLGTGAGAAAAHLVRWAGALGDLHRRSTGLRNRFEAALTRFGGASVPAADSSVEMLDHAATMLAEQLPALGIVPSPTALEALRAPATVTDAFALTPADACPDNNLEAGGSTTLLDFEGATFRHVAWDAAYLTVPWPSCWCSWRLDERASARALQAWRDAVAPAFPAVGTSAFEADLRAVRTRWAFVSTAWFLERALAGEETPAAGTAPRMPSRRAMILHRLGTVADLDEQAPGALAREVVGRLTARWGPVPLELAPAFRPAPQDGPA